MQPTKSMCNYQFFSCPLPSSYLRCYYLACSETWIFQYHASGVSSRMVQQALLMSCRYHHPKTQHLMQAYRIGTIQQPWVNLVPPLHGGIYRQHGSDNLAVGELEDDASDACSERAAYCSSSASATGNTNEQDTLKQALGRKAAFGIREAPVPLPEISKIPVSVNKGEILPIAEKSASSSPWTNLSRAAYTAMLEQNEVHQATKAYPSLDLETQQSISREYRALHERIKNEGFYNCRYSEYGKDAIRWVFLFGMFIFSLSAGWYLTSAVFLGMFWVRKSFHSRK
jgi:sphingolipid 8-(E)-desaturase